MLQADPAYQAAKTHSDSQNARDLFAKNFKTELQKRMFSETELFKKLSQDKDLAAFLIESLFEADYNGGAQSNA